MEKKDWYKVEIRELIRKNLDRIHRKVGGSYGIDVSFLHKMISEYTEQELDKAREEGRKEYFSMGMEYFSLIEDSNIYQEKGWKLPEEKAKRLQILDEIFNLLKDNK